MDGLTMECPLEHSTDSTDNYACVDGSILSCGSSVPSERSLPSVPNFSPLITNMSTIETNHKQTRALPSSVFRTELPFHSHSQEPEKQTH